jgi:hypothetical protein
VTDVWAREAALLDDEDAARFTLRQIAADRARLEK